MSSRFAQSSSRRIVLSRLLAGLVAGSVPAARRVSAQTSLTEVWTGDCSLEPGVQFLLDWQAGLPVVQITELAAPHEWVAYRHPSLPLALHIPPDWTPVAGWATTFSKSGMPQWKDRQPVLPQLTLFRIISPDNDAAFEYAVGSLAGQPRTPAEASPIAIQSLLGEDPELKEICGSLDSNPIGPSWFGAYLNEKSLFASRVFAVGAPDVLNPATIVTYTSLFGPEKDFEDLAHAVFARMIVQFMGAANGNGNSDSGDGGDGDNGGDGGNGGDDGGNGGDGGDDGGDNGGG